MDNDVLKPGDRVFIRGMVSATSIGGGVILRVPVNESGSIKFKTVTVPGCIVQPAEK
jgi:hypothetical protein